MSSRAASGSSVVEDTRAAVGEALRTAREGLGGASPRLAFLFVSAAHPMRQVLDAARAALPGCALVGCQTAGEFTERGLTHQGVAALVLASDSLLVETGFGVGVSTQPAETARALCDGFAALADRAVTEGLGFSTTVLFVDALGGQGERLVKEVLRGTRAFQQVVGGAAGDDGAFKSPAVGAGHGAGTDAAALAHVFDKKPWGIGVAHGLRPTTSRMRVTRSHGNVIEEIDDKPAFEAYRAHAARRGVELEPDSAGTFLIGNELGVYFLDELHHARAPVGVGPRGELKLVAEVAEGASVCILDGDADSMVAACARAAADAREALRGAECAGVLVFDCVCRGMILGDGFEREIGAVREAFPETPIGGFLTYGEIARFRGRLDGWHNTTAVVVAIPA